MCGSGGFCTGCRCLPPDTRVLTPQGEVALSRLQPGDAIVSLTSAGERTNAVVLRIEATPIRTPHRWVVVRLDGGRMIRGSGRHPLADGRTLSELEVGDRVDRSQVLSIESVPSDGDATWDLLPSGETGVYFVDGVALRSTLF